MKISLRLAELLGEDPNRRGLLTEIENECGIERHTVATWINNSAKYISLDALGRVAEYLIKKHGVKRETLPAALLGRDPEHFWEALASCKKLHFYLGTRGSKDWDRSNYVMSSDSILQGQMLSNIAHRFHQSNNGGTVDNNEDKESIHPFIPDFRLLKGPHRNIKPDDTGENWDEVREKAMEFYHELSKTPTSALIALGSIKANPIVELMLANAFGAIPFVNQDNVAKPRNRDCPIMFRYRDDDPQPPACCGGVKLAAKTKAPLFGMYCETDNGEWDGYGWDLPSQDVGFLLYAYWPNNVHVEVACGGFSARATICLAKKLDNITADLGAPQYISQSLHVGLYLIQFTFDPKDKNFTKDRDDRDFNFRVIRLDKEVIRSRLERKAETQKSPD
jgi:hypothetical protein